MPTAPYRFRPYFYPRPPRGGRPLSHSPLCHEVHNFYPRPPRGGRPTSISVAFAFLRFLSTPSARRATGKVRRENRPLRNFYPRPPRGGRRQCIRSKTFPQHFYPRPPRGGRPSIAAARSRHCYFYPRPPRGGRQLPEYKTPPLDSFLSTPSARRATWRRCCIRLLGSNFYPRPPRGGRQRSCISLVRAPIFLSTPSARRATWR